MSKKDQRTLLVLPDSFQDGILSRPGLDPARLFTGLVDRCCSGGNSAELKKRLLENRYHTVVIAFPSFNRELVDMQVLRSLYPRGRIVMFLPETALLQPVPGAGGHVYRRWQDEGKELFLSVLRQADLIIAASEGERTLLRANVGNVPVVTARAAAKKRPLPVRENKDRVSIIVLTCNQQETTAQCIASLKKHTQAGYELIIIDNGSTDGTVPYLKKLKKHDRRVRLLLNKTNRGFAAASNQGMRLARENYVLLLNNDVVLTDGWLERMLACARSHRSIGLVGPRTNKAVGEQVIKFPFGVEERAVQHFAFRLSVNKAGHWFETSRIIGFCMLIKREVIDRVGLLDEYFGPGAYEDFDYCLRVRQAGYRIMVAGDVFVYHVGGHGYSANRLDYALLKRQNGRKLTEKWCARALGIMDKMPQG